MLPQAANDCFKALISSGLAPGIGRQRHFPVDFSENVASDSCRPPDHRQRPLLGALPEDINKPSLWHESGRSPQRLFRLLE